MAGLGGDLAHAPPYGFALVVLGAFLRDVRELRNCLDSSLRAGAELAWTKCRGFPATVRESRRMRDLNWPVPDWEGSQFQVPAPKAVESVGPEPARHITRSACACILPRI